MKARFAARLLAVGLVLGPACILADNQEGQTPKDSDLSMDLAPESPETDGQAGYSGLAGVHFMHEVSALDNLSGFGTDADSVMKFDIDNWSLRGIYSDTEDGDDHSPDYLGVQLGYRLSSDLGESHYGLFSFVSIGGREFVPTSETRTRGFGITTTQRLGNSLGLSLRAGYQGEDDALDYDRLLSLGMNIKGAAWGRAQDELGVTYAYLDGTDRSRPEFSNFAKAYLKLRVSDSTDLSFDLQFHTNSFTNDRNDPGLWVFGTRFSTSF